MAIALPIRSRAAVSAEPSSLSPSKCSIRDIYDLDYSNELGCGAFGAVVVGRTINGERAAARARKTVPETVAVKVMHVFDEDMRELARKEVEAMRAVCGHEGICSILDFFEEETAVYIVLENIVGNTLLDQIRMCGPQKEEVTAKIIVQVVDALMHCHGGAKKVVHGDIKPENIMLEAASDASNYCVKLIDFGSSSVLEPATDSARGATGTAVYSAPEVLATGTHSPASDMWSAGIVLYAALFDSLPSSTLRAGLKAGETLPANLSQRISAAAHSLLVSMLQAAPESRITAAQALAHPWLSAAVSCSPLSDDDDVSTRAPSRISFSSEE